MSDEDHLLPFPIWMIALRGFQLALGVIILGLAAYDINSIDGGFDGIDLNMFVTIATIIIVVYILVAAFALPVIYNYWAILGLEIFGVIFWLISFALLASEVSTIHSAFDTDTECFDDCFSSYKRSVSSLQKRFVNPEDYYHAMAATAGLGAIEFVLFIITLVFSSLWLYRHRQAGGHCMPNSTSNNSPSFRRNPVPASEGNRGPFISMENV